MIKQAGLGVATKKDVDNFKVLLNQKEKSIRYVLKDKTERFISSSMNLRAKLQDVEPESIINGLTVGICLGLDFEPSLGLCYLVPYNDNKNNTKLAQFQIGYQGLIQLYLRTGQVETLNVITINKDVIQKMNPLTEEFTFNWDNYNKDDETVGYMFYYKGLNGFKKTLYWSRESMEKHARKHSSAYQYDLKKGYKNSVWSKDFDSMGLKTLIRMAGKFLPKSIEVQDALKYDQAVIKKADVINGNLTADVVEYIDNDKDNYVTEAEVAENKIIETKAKDELKKIAKAEISQDDPISALFD